MDLVDNLTKLFIQEQGIACLPPSYEDKYAGVAPKELFLNQIDMENTQGILDAFILLINAETFLKELHGKNFTELLENVKKPAFGETTMKVEIIAGQLASVGSEGPTGLQTDGDAAEP